MRRRSYAWALAMAIGAAAVPAVSSAHVERSAYWPDPAPDCSLSPCAGGAVPAIRPLASSVNRKALGDTRVVCQKNSLTLLKQSIARAVKSGYDIRPTDHRTFTAREGRKLLKLNRKLFKMCGFSEIQAAVTASGNNDRVVIMPGLYLEPTSRAQPTQDPKCQPYRIHSDSGDPGALSHAYQMHCPNDANLVAVIGRGEGPGKDPDPAPEDRHGIPNVGACIRCNLQIEGSGVSADDVVLEAGDETKGNGGPSAAGHKKDVGVYVDRADGFVLRNVTVRHAREHDIYAMETDGYVLDSFKAFYAGGYGVLTFVEDHGLIQNCEAAGSGDSGIYPGAGAKTNAGRDAKWYPQARFSQELRYCDMHHNTGGFSGTNSNATHIHHNNFYDNALGLTTDVFTAPGHPGFPQQGNVLEDNNFYSNNFNPYVAGSDVEPSIAAPVGTGLWFAGGNDNIVRRNRFWDNHRRGTMLFAVPDVTVCGPSPIGSDTPVPGCNPAGTTTSFNNRYTGNLMGVAPDGSAKPNGVDFWWDSFPGNTGNCWWGNVAAPGRSIVTSPSSLPDCDGGTNPSASVGTGDLLNQVELVGCLVGFTTGSYPAGDPRLCDWTANPPQPGARQTPPAYGSSIARERSAHFQALCGSLPQSRTCAPFVGAGLGFTGLQPVAVRHAVTYDGAWARRALGLYTCRDWRGADGTLRTRLLARLHRWNGGAVVGDRLLGFGSVLSDQRASALFDDRCSAPYAGRFMLYKMYGQAAGFAGIAP
jgi:Right handed beta helix region